MSLRYISNRCVLKVLSGSVLVNESAKLSYETILTTLTSVQDLSNEAILPLNEFTPLWPLGSLEFGTAVLLS